MIFRTPAGLRVLDLTGFVTHHSDMWGAIDRYDDAHGTSFWDLLRPGDHVEWDPHLRYNVPPMTMRDFEPPFFAGCDVSGADSAVIKCGEGTYYLGGEEYSFEVAVSLARSYHAYTIGARVHLTFFKGDRILAEGYIHNHRGVIP